MNLAYLNLYTYNDFAKGITADFSNIKALHTPINDYLRTIYLDDISAFLILYSILETLADTETVYFVLYPRTHGPTTETKLSQKPCQSFPDVLV